MDKPICSVFKSRPPLSLCLSSSYHGASSWIGFLLTLLLLLFVYCPVTRATAVSSVNSATIVTFVIDENAPIGHEVGRIQLKDAPHSATADSGSALTFTLQDTSYFNFDPSDPSRLIVRNPLDRDADRKLCTESGWPEVCSWSGVIFVSDGRLLSLRVVVRDTNDNVPRWQSTRPQDGSTQLHISVSENCAPGTMVDLPLASDPDIGENSIVRYELVKPAGMNVLRVPFDISSTNVHNRALYRLVVKGPLDRETQSTYHLTVAAIDGGGNQGLAQLTVHVTDENDNKPIFKHLRGPGNQSVISDELKPFVITVDEDIPVGTKLAQHPVATDEDEGDFGRVSYAFALSTPDTVKRDFHIDPDTGIFTVRNALDCDTGGLTQYQFVVIAQDHGAPPLTATARVIINVQDKNDNAPIITITSAVPPSTPTGPDSTGHASSGSTDPEFDLQPVSERKSPLRLVENAPEGKLIATITVHDPDTDENGKFTCVLGKSDELQLTYVKNLGKLSVYQLSSTRPVDRERQPELRVTLRCRDHGQPSQSNTELLTVHVVDLNDNPPEFSSKRYSFQVSSGAILF
ncbi:unnamed protein product [Echinostoma caproni]|uniref:Protocadherin-1 n=1 Tax=Echinostoma caproni TaxID=27848 RepID=A0A183A666_9TREM|nr:unnamed protein product [Echinostoma caproni]